MDAHDYATALRRRWRSVLACVLLGVAGALLVTALMPRTYTATSQLFVSTGDTRSDTAYQGGLFTEERVKSYTRVVTSPAVLNGVIDTLRLDTTPGRLAGHISAQAPLDTTLVDISVTDPSAARAQAVADATALQLTRYITTIEGARGNPLVKASVVKGSEPPTTPSSPRPEVNLAIGLFAGVVVGVGGAVLRHATDTVLRTAEEVTERLGLGVLGAVPPPRRRRLRAAPPAGTTRRAEALSLLRTRLRFGVPDGPPHTLLVAGPRRGEGRTRTVLDLAGSVARTGLRVVVVEADLRRPRIAAEWGLARAPGLTDVLTGEVPVQRALRSVGDPPVRVLTAGRSSADPATLLSSPALPRLLRTLAADADLVLVDSPPLLSYADAAALAPAVEGVLFVVRAGRTRQGEARRALDTLAAVHARVLGAVLTGTRAGRLADWRPPRDEEPPPPRDEESPPPRDEEPSPARRRPERAGPPPPADPEHSVSLPARHVAGAAEHEDRAAAGPRRD
ncbi:Wzz/FepE/Etk N-terminal domain-containing protein [Streptomyces longwoodensis]|uniref:Wzz/FepE/Etk N-terminal domain-containing protein n=1 Tax=Streptomyces longwoodensis TaxID=68231 RepID=UPI0033CD7241